MAFKFYPLFGKILNYWFPPTDGYDVCLQSRQWPIPDCRRPNDFTITFAIEHNHHPLLLIEIKPPSDFQLDSGRVTIYNATFQVIQRLDEVGPINLHFDRLYAISAVGKRWRACYVLKGRGAA